MFKSLNIFKLDEYVYLMKFNSIICIADFMCIYKSIFQSKSNNFDNADLGI